MKKIFWWIVMMSFTLAAKDPFTSKESTSSQKTHYQVEITAYIMYLEEDCLQELGAFLGVQTQGSSNGLKENYQMDLPLVSQEPGQWTITLARLSHQASLQMTLADLEKQGHGQLVASPRLLTQLGHTSLIEAGEEVPYQEKTASGDIGVTFKKAVLSLRVKPSLSPDGRVILTLRVNQDQVSHLTVQGVPRIRTQRLQTRVLAHSRETLILGGIYEQSLHQTSSRIPVLSDIPWLGRLFHYEQTQEKRRVLLIFITPELQKEKEFLGHA